MQLCIIHRQEPLERGTEHSHMYPKNSHSTVASFDPPKCCAGGGGSEGVAEVGEADKKIDASK